MSLLEVEIGKEYTIDSIVSNDEELEGFLFTLGCYKGSKITVISRMKSSCIVSIKDGRYNIDKDLAEVVVVCN